ncbi:response regulator [Desulfatitalea alkaliphila]|uniref:Response regulator n=1 Tax=Desulfatitalea alkaliphila TaxID=2929485 RepID=A0AA41R3R1_9BACT|nr:response regulator [Desulfatitalea alkaliphila]MCJ8500360.1 response regulator [Desulfatitalea alkaliphila]
MKTLIAEDDFTSRTIARRQLERFGPCDAVEDGLAAVTAFERALQAGRPYDLVCLDIMMPDMDGQEALRRIRATEAQMGIRGTGEVKVIMLSALDDPRSVVEAFYRGGATAYLVKPLAPERLESELRQLGLLNDAQEARRAPTTKE